jgi:hypothetical protein
VRRLRRWKGVAAIEALGHDVARRTVERLMRAMGLQGAVRGKPAGTTVSDKPPTNPGRFTLNRFEALASASTSSSTCLYHVRINRED